MLIILSYCTQKVASKKYYREFLKILGEGLRGPQKNFENIFSKWVPLLDISSSYFHTREFPRTGSKAKDGEKEERKKDERW